MKRRQFFTRTAFFDFLLNMLLVFVVLFILAVVRINPEAKEEGDVKLNERFLIVVDWANDLNDDVDTYVKDPQDHLVYFRRREDGLMHLERDDVGKNNDSVLLDSGKRKFFDFNEERVLLRGIIPGEYIVNVHMYRRSSNESVAVTVTLLDLAGKDAAAVSSTVFLSKNGDEKTAFRFTLDDAGTITDINHEFMSLYTFKVRREEQ